MGINCFAKTLLSRYLGVFEKKQLILRVLVRSLKKSILRVTNIKKQNITHPKAAKLATLYMYQPLAV